MYFGEAIILDHIDFVLEQNNLFCSKLDAFLRESEIDNNFDLLNEASLKEIGKNIWGVLLRIFRKLKVMFENLISNINLFKEININKQKSDDLFAVLKLLNLKTEDDGAKYLAILFRIQSKLKNDVTDAMDSKLIGIQNSVPGKSTFDHEILIHTKDIDDAIESAEKSKEYERIKANEYKEENLQKIPTVNINSDMKKSKSNLVNYINELEKQENFNNKIENEEVKSLSGKLITFLKKIINYYKFRVQLLTEFFKHAKVSISAVGKNIKEISKGEFATLAKNNKNIKQFIKKFNSDDVSKLEELYNKMKEANSDKNYSEYSKLHEKACDILGISSNSTFTSIYKIIDNNEKLYGFNVVPNKNPEINVGTRKLYHHSYEEHDDILKTGLLPNAIGNGNGKMDKIYYPEPRVYFHLSVPKDKGNLKIGGQYVPGFFGIGITTIDKYTKGVVYELGDASKFKVYQDPEYGKSTACYIVSDKPIPVKQIDLDQWYKDNEVKDDNKNKEE